MTDDDEGGPGILTLREARANLVAARLAAGRTPEQAEFEAACVYGLANQPKLVEGDEIKCWHCPGDVWHVMHRASTPGPYDRPMLFITCGGGEYYAGNVGNPADQPVRSPTSKG